MRLFVFRRRAYLLNCSLLFFFALEINCVVATATAATAAGGGGDGGCGDENIIFFVVGRSVGRVNSISLEWLALLNNIELLPFFRPNENP